MSAKLMPFSFYRSHLPTRLRCKFSAKRYRRPFFVTKCSIFAALQHNRPARQMAARLRCFFLSGDEFQQKLLQ